jgi:hypothetical protein
MLITFLSSYFLISILCMLVLPTLIRSQNTYTFNATVTTVAYWKGVSVDNTGTYLIACAYYVSSTYKGAVWMSNDGGQDWYSVTPAGSSTPLLDWRTVATDGTGKYYAAAATNNGIYYGSITNPLLPFPSSITWAKGYTTGQYSALNQLIMSDSGKYVVCTLSPGGLAYSSNYGASFAMSNADNNIGW